MSCERWREAISAAVDAEHSELEGGLVSAHLAQCPACRAYRRCAEDDRRRSGLGSATAAPDLARRIVKLNAGADRAQHPVYARVALAVVAIEVIVAAAPALILGDARNTSAHAARHLGAFSVAYAVALLVVVIRPARARTVLPVAAVLAATLAITSVIDLAQARVPLIGEAQHVPELISVLLVWSFTLRTAKRTTNKGAVRSSAVVRLVDDDYPVR